MTNSVIVMICGPHKDYFREIDEDRLIAEVKKGKEDLEKRLNECSKPTSVSSSDDYDHEIVVTPEFVDESIREFLEAL